MAAAGPLAGRKLSLAVDLRRCVGDTFTAARILLVADVLMRTLEIVAGDQVLVDLQRGDRTAYRAVASLARALAVSSTLVDAPESAPTHGAGEAGLIPSTLEIGPGRIPHSRPDGESPGAWPILRHRDQRALRLALLRFATDEPAVLTEARMSRAEEALDRWRFKVAARRDMPTAAAPADVMATSYERLTRQLDTRAVLTALHRLESDHAIPSGAKFQAFTPLDRVLGLELILDRTAWRCAG
jgi:hypothetical protein